VGTAIAMTMASVGRTSSGNMALSAQETIRAAERHMRISRDDYLARALGLWRVTISLDWEPFSPAKPQ